MPDDRDKEGRPKPDYSRGYYDREGRWVEYRDIGQSARDAGGESIRPGRRGPGTHGIAFAVILIAVGVLLFLDNIGLFHFSDIWRFWPVAFIALGVAKLTDSRGIGSQVWAAMWVVIGSAFLLDNLGLWHMRWNVIWPLGLVAFGIMTLVNALDRQPRGGPSGPIAGNCRGTSTDSTLHEWATFGGVKRRVDTQDFQGGEMIAVFGGIEIDLRRAVIPPGKEVLIDANATFGGIELRVPENWIVVVRGIGIFGGYEDKTIPPRESDRATAPRLVIKGYAVFGGVSVQN